MRVEPSLFDLPAPPIPVGEPEVDAFIRAERPDREPPLPTLVLHGGSDEIRNETIVRWPGPVRLELTDAQAEALNAIAASTQPPKGEKG